MVAILSLGIAPSIAILSYFYLKDKVTEPVSLIVKTFIFGAILVFPIMFIQYALINEGWTNNHFIQSFFYIAFFEEFFKWFVFMFSIYYHTEFDDHYDGIVYAVSISLGFATVENVLYLISNGIEYAMMRAFFPVSSHALFGVIMGYYFGRAKTTSHHTTINQAIAFFIPFILHGIYNYVLVTINSNWIYILIPFMIFLWMYALRRAKQANQSFPIDN